MYCIRIGKITRQKLPISFLRLMPQSRLSKDIPMDERRCVEVLTRVRDMGWQGREITDALDHAIATIERERWRPIAEAPMDGADILICGGTYCVGWDEGLPMGREVSIAFWDKSIGGHWHGNEANAHDEWRVHKPTHWRPLPDPQPDGQEGA
jgi:hypothetical protein